MDDRIRELLTTQDVTHRVSFWDKRAYAETVCDYSIPECKKNGWESFTMETFARLYGFPSKMDDVDPEWAHIEAAHAVMDALPEFEQLCQLVKDEPVLAAAATMRLSKSAANIFQTSDAPSKDDASIADIMRELEMESDTSELGEAAKRSAEYISKDEYVRAAFRKALEEAIEEVGDSQEALMLFGWGTEPGKHTTKADAAVAKELAKRLKGMANLATYMGRMNGLVEASATLSPASEYGERVGVTIGANIEQILSSEYVPIALGVPELFYKNFAERSLQQYDVADREDGEKDGPVAMMLDTSGSMDGTAGEFGKACCLALGRELHKQARPTALGLFDTNLRFRSVDLRNELLAILDTNMDGGTDFNRSTDQFLTYLDGAGFPTDKSDLLLVTDGWCKFSTDMAARIADRFSRLFVILAPGGSVSGLSEVGKLIPVRSVSIERLLEPGAAAEVFKELLW